MIYSYEIDGLPIQTSDIVCTTDGGGEIAAGQFRDSVGSYCLAQAGKPYNLNFFDPDTEDGFYCSQLPYLAYLPHGIDLNTGMGVPDVPGTSRIVFPQEIWSGCSHRRAAAR
jgi:hypothetical protein